MSLNLPLQWSSSESGFSHDSSNSSDGDDSPISDVKGASKNRSGKIDLSYHQLDTDMLESHLQSTVTCYGDTCDSCDNGCLKVQRVLLYNNHLTELAPTLTSFTNMTLLDLSNNMIRELPDSIANLRGLTHLYLRHNLMEDESFPKELGSLKLTLKELNLSGNLFTTLPQSILELFGLRNLFVGGNRLCSIPSNIKNLGRLRVLYVGGNFLKEIPPEICHLSNLVALILCSNQLEMLPDSICKLRRLECLQLHQNHLTTLPSGLIHLKGLRELSLRDNPLVVRFVREMTFHPSTLLELAARVIKIQALPYNSSNMPLTLTIYLDNSHSCVNPRCKGVYFDSRVEHVKFVDFCGKYRIPLLQYLCSSRCSAERPAVGIDTEDVTLSTSSKPEEEARKLRRVLLG